MENIAWEYLDPLQRVQIAATRPDVYNQVKDEQLEAQMGKQILREKEGGKECSSG